MVCMALYIGYTSRTLHSLCGVVYTIQDSEGDLRSFTALDVLTEPDLEAAGLRDICVP